MKVVINRCHGGFGLSEKAYERLIDLGVPVQKYIEQERGEDGLYKPQPENDGEVIFDRTLTKGEALNDSMLTLGGRYWDSWIDKDRTHRLLLEVVESLGKEANGRFAELKIVEIPDGVEYEIQEYDGSEWIAEKHRTWS